MKELKHPKQDFQVERIAFFSDAVFAIAITLLVIELKPPAITKETTADQMHHALGELKYKIAALLLSFALIVNYWRRHHSLFKHLHNYNKQVITANMIVLVPIIFFPFTTSFLYENLSSDNQLVLIPFRFFMLNNVFAGATMYYFYWMVMKKYPELSYPMEKEESHQFNRRLLVSTLSFFLIFLFSFLSFKFSFIGILPAAALNFYTKLLDKNRKPVAEPVVQRENQN